MVGRRVASYLGFWGWASGGGTSEGRFNHASYPFAFWEAFSLGVKREGLAGVIRGRETRPVSDVRWPHIYAFALVGSEGFLFYFIL